MLLNIFYQFPVTISYCWTFSCCLVDKFQMIEDEYAALREQGSKRKSLEAKILECRKEIESQLQAEMDAKVCSASWDFTNMTQI